MLHYNWSDSGFFWSFLPGRKISILPSSNAQRSHTRHDIMLPRIHPFVLVRICLVGVILSFSTDLLSCSFSPRLCFHRSCHAPFLRDYALFLLSCSIGLIPFEEPSAWELSPHEADQSKDKPQAIKLFLLSIPKSMFLMHHTSLVSLP